MFNTISDVPSAYHVKALELAQRSLFTKEAFQACSEGNIKNEFLTMLEEAPQFQPSQANIFSCSIQQVFSRRLLSFQGRHNRFNHNLLLHLHYFFRV